MVDERESELAEIGPGSAVALILLVVACVLLAVLPAAVALQAPTPGLGWVATAVGTSVGVIFSLKLGAGAWGWQRSCQALIPPAQPLGTPIETSFVSRGARWRRRSVPQRR